jgi:hypothetical protein
MPGIELVPVGTGPTDPYASDQDVADVLGTIASRLPTWVSVPRFRASAHALVVDRLAKVYPDAIPAFDGNGLGVVTLAEAKVAAAEILDAIRVNLPDLGEAPAELRKSAWESLDDGVVGYPIGSGGDSGSGGTGPTTTVAGPRVSSYTPASAFPDPYEAHRDTGIDFL